MTSRYFYLLVFYINNENISFCHIEIITPLSIQEVRNILSKNIRPKRTFGFNSIKTGEKELFEAVFWEDEFNIQKIIITRNSFLPQIKGYIQPDFDGTKLVADLSVYTLVLAFLIFWLSVVFFIGIIYNEKYIYAIFPLLMIFFAIGLMHYGFNKGKIKSIVALKKIVKGEIIKEES